MKKGVQQLADSTEASIDSFLILSEKTIGQTVLDPLNLEFDVVEVSSDALSRTYYDTSDGLLYANEMSLFVERSDSHPMVCLKRLDDLSIIGIVSGTYIPPLASDFPQGPLRDLLRTINPTRAFLPQVDLNCRQRKLTILNRTGEEIAHLVIDEGCLAKNLETGKSGLPESFLHLFPHKNHTGDYERMLRIYENLPEMKRVDQPFWSAILEHIESPIAAADNRPATTLSSSLSAGEALRRIMRLQLVTMEANEPGIRANIDPEFLHDYRIALRQSRTILGQFKDVIPASYRDKLGPELKWLGQITGELRDLDVYLLRIEDYKSWLPEEVRPDLEPLQRFLAKRNGEEQARLVVQFDSPRYRKLIDTWRCLTKDTADKWEGKTAERPVRSIVSARIWKLYRRILKQGKAILRGDSVKAEGMHRLRIACKKLRYMLTMFAGLYPSSEIDKLVRILKRLQDDLGDYQDFEVQVSDLHKFASEMMKDDRITSATFMAMGRLERRMEDRQQAAYLAFEELFERFSRKKNRKRFARLFSSDAG